MADFETTISETATKLATLIEQTDEAESALDVLREQVAASSEQIETQWEVLSSAAQSLLEKINMAQEELESEGTQAIEQINQFQEMMETWQTEMSQGVESFQAAIDALEGQSDTLMSEQESAWEEVKTVLTAVEDKTTEAESALDETLTQSESFLQDEAIAAVQAHREEIETRSAALESYINEQCLPEITSKTTEFAERMVELLETLTAKLESTGENTQQATTESLDQLKQLQTDLIDSLVGNADQLNSELENIGKTIDQTTSTAVDAFGMMKTGVDTANVGLESAIGVFEEAKEMLSKFM